MNNQTGFSLLELCTLLLLIATASHIMLPNLQELMQYNRSQQSKDLLIKHLNYARAYAIIHAEPVQFCGSSNGIDCDHQWHLGWVTRTRGGELLQQHSHSATASTPKWRGFSPQLTFLANGTSHASNGQFNLCDTQGKLRWQIILNRQGRVREQRANNADNNPC